MSTLEPVIRGGLCIGCGACLAADRDLELVFDEERQCFRPSGPGNHRAAAVCPAVGVDFEFLHQRRFPGATLGPHGVVDSVWLAQSTDAARNLRSSSGGLIKELALAYLRTPEADGVISIVHKGGLDFRAALVTDPAEVERLPGSIYHALRFDDALRILEERSGNYGLIAIPCQLEGIFSYVFRCAPELAGRVRMSIGLLCGWQYTHHAVRAICEYKKVEFSRLTGISWRGGGPVGKLRLYTSSGTTAVSRRLDFDYQVAFDRSFNNPRCHLCIDHSNFLADIVVGDAWLPSTVFTRTGISLVICRTPEMRYMLQRLAEEGRVRLTEVSVDEIVESQGRRAVFGDFSYAYQQYLSQRGLPHPVMAGPNRASARLVSEREVDRFHRELSRKLHLQRERRYHTLWWRKLVWESPRLLWRYLSWFLVRILRIKSLTGRRKEVARRRLVGFR